MSCTRRDESPPPGRPACPRRAGRERGVSGGRTRTEQPARTRHMPFFSPPAQVDTAGLRITEDALDRWSWPEAGEAVGVPEVSVCVHPAIMPEFQAP